MKKSREALVILGLVALGMLLVLPTGVCRAAVASSANYAIPADVISSGGGMSSSSGYINTGVIGQAGPVGKTDESGSYLAFSGYLYTTPAATDDPDGDGIIAIVDNCPNVANAGQADINVNGIGDVCDDTDADGMTDADEIIIGTNYTNPDTDYDGVTDGDEILAATDPLVPDNGDPVLTGAYHTGQFMDDQYGLGGEIQLERMLLTFDGTVKGDYLRLIDKNGQSGQTGYFYYDAAPDNSFAIDGGHYGQLSNDGNTILLADVDALDQAIAIMVGGKQGTGLDESLLSGTYIGVELRNFDEPLSSALLTSLNRFYFDGSGQYNSTTLLNSEGLNEDGLGLIYSVAADGTVVMDSGTGFATIDGELLMFSDTTIDPDISMTVAVRQGGEMSEADLVGEFFYQEFIQNVTTNQTDNLISTLTFDGNGNLSFASQLSSDGLTEQVVTTYTVDTEGNVSIVGGPGGALSSNGEYLVMSDTEKGDNDIRAGIGVKKPEALLDSDGDGLSNLEELQLGSNPFAVDSDSDGLNDGSDNCPAVANDLQEDGDGDGVGDVCDNCIFNYNPAQFDLNLDGEGDVCDVDSDSDADTIFDAYDNCPAVPNVGQEDFDSDGIGNACEIFRMITPNGGESFDVGSTYTVQWNADPDAVRYRLHYFDSDGTPYVVANVGAVSSYDWQIPLDAVPESGKLFRVTAFDANDFKLGEAWSTDTFTVVLQPLIVLSPANGVTWTVDSTYTLQWTPHPDAVRYRLHYFDVDSTPHVVGNVGAVSSLLWNVPDWVTPESGKTFRITAFDAADAKLGESWLDGTFNVVPNPYVMTAPSPGVIWNLGVEYTITWGAHPEATRYNIHYFDADGTPHKVAKFVTGTSINWTVPYGTSVEDGKQLRVTAFNAVNAKLGEAWLQGTFNVGPAFAMTSPSGGEVWALNSTQTIQWNAHPLAVRYNLHYFDGNGTPHTVAVLGNVTSYDWTIPANASIEAGKSLRVTAFDGSDVKVGEAWSGGTFEVVP